MSSPQLIPRHIFGINGSHKGVLYFVDDTSFLYVAGNNVVIQNLEQKGQKVIPGTPDAGGISALNIAPNKKVLAIAERAVSNVGGFGQPERPPDHRASSVSSESRNSILTDGKSYEGGSEVKVADVRGPIISLYEVATLKRRKILASSDLALGSKEYVCLSFSSDGKSIAAQTGPPDWNLVLWNLEKFKITSSVKVSTMADVHQVLFCPADSSLVTVVGDGFVKHFKLTAESSFRQIATDLAKRDNLNYLWHLWLCEPGEHGDDIKDPCIYSCETGELIYMEGSEITWTLSPDASGVQTHTEIIAQYSKGFICGETEGRISVYEKVDDKDSKEKFKKTSSFKVDSGKTKVSNIALTPTEESLVCILDSNQLVVVNFQQREAYKHDEIPKEVLAQIYHVEGITGLDVCMRKPIIVTCSVDKSLRVWNYLDRSCEIAKYFHEEAFSVSLHPSGFHVIIGFSDKLRFMNLLIDDIRTSKEIGIKGCQECSFSNGGQYFAAVHVNVIQIFSTYTCENIGNLRGHSGKVRSIWWSSDDSTMLSAGADGAIYEWKLKNFKRSRENVLKGCIYTSVTGVAGSSSFFAVGSDKRLKELDENQILKVYPSAVLLTQIVLPDNSRLLFAATEIGSIRTYKYPLTGEYQEAHASCSSITRIRTSCDDTLLICAGEDGILSLFDIKDKEKAILSGAVRREKEALGWSEEVLITKAELEEIRTHVQELEEKVKDLTSDNEYQLRLKDLAANERIKSLNESYQKELDDSRTKYDRMLHQKNQEALELEEKQVKSEEKHMQQLKDIEEQWRQKMMAEVDRYSCLEQDKENLHEEWQGKYGALKEAHEQAFHELTEEFESRLREEHLALDQCQHDLAQAQRDFEEIKRQTEEDTDHEIEDLKEKYEGKLAQEKEVVLRLKGENGLLKKKFNEFQKDMEEQKLEIKALFEQKKELYQTLACFERDINGLKKDVVERDETIGEKERRIYELKRKTQELEKVKFVLDYKIKDLKATIEPREIELQTAKLQITNIEKELERAYHGNTRKQLSITEMKLKIDGMQNEIHDLRTQNYDANYAIKSLHHDIYQLLQDLEEPLRLKDAVRSLTEKYVSNKMTIVPVDNNLLKESARQRDYLERTIDGLKQKLSKDSESNHKDHLRIMRENVSLIKELNELRRELKVTRLTAHKGAQKKSEGQDNTEDLENLRSEIKHLYAKLEAKDAHIKRLEKLLEESEMVEMRPMSRAELPPMDAVQHVPASDPTEVERLQLQIKKLEDDLKSKWEHLKAITNEQDTHERSSRIQSSPRKSSPITSEQDTHERSRRMQSSPRKSCPITSEQDAHERSSRIQSSPRKSCPVTSEQNANERSSRIQSSPRKSSPRSSHAGHSPRSSPAERSPKRSSASDSQRIHIRFEDVGADAIHLQFSVGD